MTTGCCLRPDVTIPVKFRVYGYCLSIGAWKFHPRGHPNLCWALTESPVELGPLRKVERFSRLNK